MKQTLSLTMLLALASTLNAQIIKGDKIPNFSTLDQDGTEWVLKKQLKKADYLVIYFYPAAFTGGCTKQACTYRDQKAELEKAGAAVAGVSGDNPETLGLFALEHGLNFTLLADENGAIAKIFGVPHSDGGSIDREIGGTSQTLVRGTTIKRWTFILDQKGVLVYKDAEVDASNDSFKVLAFLNSRK